MNWSSAIWRWRPAWRRGRVEVVVGPAPFELLRRGLAQVVERIFSAKRERAAEALAAVARPVRRAARRRCSTRSMGVVAATAMLLLSFSGDAGGRLVRLAACPRSMYTSMVQVRQTRYDQIADELRDRVEAGEFGTGQTPSQRGRAVEAFGASRVTVRRALEVLRDEGLVDSRQGFGWFVATDPRAPDARPPRHDREPARGRGRRRRARKVLDFRFVTAPAAGARGARRRHGACGSGGCNLADGEPFALRDGVVPRAVRRRSVAGPTSSAVAVLRADRRAARRRTPDDRRRRGDRATTPNCSGCPTARRCCAASGSPARSTTAPVLVSEHVFPAHLTEFVVDLPQADASMAPERPPPRRVADRSAPTSRGRRG